MAIGHKYEGPYLIFHGLILTLEHTVMFEEVQQVVLLAAFETQDESSLCLFHILCVGV